jgi:hypothetical protein
MIQTWCTHDVYMMLRDRCMMCTWCVHDHVSHDACMTISPCNHEWIVVFSDWESFYTESRSVPNAEDVVGTPFDLCVVVCCDVHVNVWMCEWGMQALTPLSAGVIPGSFKRFWSQSSESTRRSKFVFVFSTLCTKNNDECMVRACYAHDVMFQCSKLFMIHAWRVIIHAVNMMTQILN